MTIVIFLNIYFNFYSFFHASYCRKAVFLNIMQFISPLYDENSTLAYFCIQKQSNCWDNWRYKKLKKHVVAQILSLTFIYIFVLKRCLELELLWYQLELLYSLPKKIGQGLRPPISVPLFINHHGKKIIRSKRCGNWF